MDLRVRPSATAALLAAAAVALGACGKAERQQVASGGPAHELAPVVAPGAVSVATRNTTRLGGKDANGDAAAVARTVYPGLTTETRPRAVALVDRERWPTALAAAALAGAPIVAPIVYSEGHEVPEVTRQTIEAMRPLGVPELGGTQLISVGGAPTPPRLVGRTVPAGEPVLAAVEIAHLLLTAAGANAPHAAIVLAAEAPPAMQMPAAGLAAESGVPILFATRPRVPAATIAALKALGRPAIYVIDAAALGPHALGQLSHLGTLSIVSSGSGEEAGPVANAIAVARYTNGTFGWGIKEPGHGIVLANSSRPLDAPAAAPLSSTGDYAPLLLVEGPGPLPPQLASYLSDIQPAYTSAPQFRPVRGVYNHGWLIGDESAISAVTQAEVDSLLEIRPRKQTPEEASVTQAE
jgi:hypothetical protein